VAVVDWQGIQNELSVREPDVRPLLERGHRYAEQSSSPAAADVAEALDAAKTAWRSVRDRASSKAAQLREVNRRAEVN